MISTEEVLPNRPATAKHGSGFGEMVGDLTECEKVPDLLNPGLPQEPGSGRQAVRR